MSDPIFVFDKDGVIVDTESIKLRVYEEMLGESYPDKVQAIRAYAVNNVGVPRLTKFTYILENIIGMSQENAQASAKTYTNESLIRYKEELAEANLVPGIRDFFQSTPNLKFVCSAAHKSEVDAHLYGHKLSAFLQDWYSTTDKAEVLIMLKRKFGTDLIFWGDTYADYHASKRAEVPFIAVVLPHINRSFEEFGVPVIPDFTNKKKILGLVDKLIYNS